MRSGNRRPGIVLLCFVAIALGPLPAQPFPARAAEEKTVVSLTFDDGSADQYAVRSILTSHGMRATFFVISGLTGKDSYYMTWDQVHDLAEDGNEIGGHTRDHVNLTTLSAAEQRRQVCEDRQELIRRGFTVTDFAYPESGVDSSAEATVKECGYRSGRAVGDVQCNDCAWAESVPPPDSYRTRTPEPVTSSTSLSDIRRWIADADEHGGGWIQLVFHRICTGCGGASITESDFDALLHWLRARAWRGTVVKTVAEALDGPPVAPAPPPPPFRSAEEDR